MRSTLPGSLLAAPEWIPDGETRPRVRFFLHEVSLPVDSALTRPR